MKIKAEIKNGLGQNNLYHLLENYQIIEIGTSSGNFLSVIPSTCSNNPVFVLWVILWTQLSYGSSNTYLEKPYYI